MTSLTHIIADIGGTNARFAFVENDFKTLGGIEILSCNDFPDFLESIKHYQTLGHVDNFHSICIAVPGPVEFDHITLPNSPWEFSRKALAQALNCEVEIINDFAAQAMSINVLAKKDIQWIGKQRPQGNQAKAILGPGTGLGVSAMLANGDIVPTEGGHLAFAPTTAHEISLLEVLWEKFDRVSVERLLSGPGIENIYWANSVLEEQENELSAQEISDGAFLRDEICLQTVEDFTAILGSVAGEIAIAMGALDGVYLSGGILKKMGNLLNLKLLRERFDEKGRFSDYCSNIPLALVLNDYPGLIGCAQTIQKKVSDL